MKAVDILCVFAPEFEKKYQENRTAEAAGQLEETVEFFAGLLKGLLRLQITLHKTHVELVWSLVDVLVVVLIFATYMPLEN